MGDDYNYIYKIIMLGESSVGKTNLLTRFTKNEFNEDLRPTIGVEFATKSINTEDAVIKT